MSKITQAVIPVAGFATRFLPVAKAFSKALLPVVDKPVVQFLVEDAVAAGIREITFVVSPEKKDIQNYFSPSPALEKKLQDKGEENLLTEVKKLGTLAKFDFVIQEEMLGDGHAILQAREHIGAEPFLVIFGDDLIFGSSASQLISAYDKYDCSVVGLQKVLTEELSHYGVAGVGYDGRIETFVEKPQPAEAPSDLAIVGKYVCTPRIFEILESHPNASGEIRLIDALEILLQEEKVFGQELSGQRFDCGSKAGWLAANMYYAKEKGLEL